MAKNISSGVERFPGDKKKAVEKQIDQMSQQWKVMRTRIDVILLSTNVMKTNEIRQQCHALDAMTTPEREAHITKHWGPQYLNKVQPLLQQLATLEALIAEAG